MSEILYDLSPPISATTPVWPGDTAFSSEWKSRLGTPGSTVNLSAFATTPHVAAHADAPLHTEDRGISIDRQPLSPYVGVCRVVEVKADRAGRTTVGASDLAGLNSGPRATRPPRILVRTGCSFASGFPDGFSAISPAWAAELREQGVVLLGTDAPSVDPFASTELLAHHALLGRGIAILEGLDLAAVPLGDYELIALPLRLVGLDASPVRAVLRALDSRRGGH